jgi:hypothetical protein
VMIGVSFTCRGVVAVRRLGVVVALTGPMTLAAGWLAVAPAGAATTPVFHTQVKVSPLAGWRGNQR